MPFLSLSLSDETYTFEGCLQGYLYTPKRDTRFLRNLFLSTKKSLQLKLIERMRSRQLMEASIKVLGKLLCIPGCPAAPAKMLRRPRKTEAAQNFTCNRAVSKVVLVVF